MHTETEHLGHFEKVLIKCQVPYRCVKIFEGEALPASIPPGDGLIVLGGPMSVHDHIMYPWMKPEIDLILRTVKAERPVLGVCLGAQMMARALGAKIYPAMAAEIGCSSVTLSRVTGDRPVFEGFEHEFVVFQWHSETFDLPSGARRLARGLLVPNQAFQYGQKAFAVQFHLEATVEMAREWVKVNPNDLAAAEINNPDLMLMTFEAHSYGMEKLAKKFMENFLLISNTFGHDADKDEVL